MTVLDELDDLEVARLTGMLSGALLTQIISAAATLGVADALAAGPETISTLSDRCGADADALRRLLRGLAAVGLLEELSADLFDLTDMGHLLRSDHSRSLRSWAIVQGQLMAPLWTGLASAVQTGQPAAQAVFGKPFYEHLGANPALDEHWNRAMVETARAWWGKGQLLDALDWTDVRSVVDVGGGRGGLLAVLLERHPHLSGVVYDLPHVVAHAPGYLAGRGVADRAQAVGGNFFDAVPLGADAYVLARVVFNWDDELALRLLNACREAMGAGARLLVIDHVVVEDGPPHPATVNDVSLLSMGGRARSIEEWKNLAGKAGLRLTGPPQSPSAVDAWMALVMERC